MLHTIMLKPSGTCPEVEHLQINVGTEKPDWINRVIRQPFFNIDLSHDCSILINLFINSINMFIPKDILLRNKWTYKIFRNYTGY